jgi:hypothetical protein
MQNYKNHLRLNPAHHFVLLPIVLTLFIWSSVYLFQSQNPLVNKVIFLLFSFGFLILAMITRVYALKNQDRIIRLEMRQRYFELTGKSFNEKEKQLRLGQIIALRFASNEELLPLIEKSISENLTKKEIKLAVKDWQADTHRI